MSCAGAYYVDNWFYGYQVFCCNPTEYWINPLGWVVINLLILYLVFRLLNRKKVKE